MPLPQLAKEGQRRRKGMSSFDVSAEITKIQDEKSTELLMSGIHDDSAITDIAPSENLWD